ncbi:MAG: fused MFS/spermidine synthase [Mariprofundaceae bacterium]|nr:fused MFS/spermidine synthase [Mariprofundaceae bacterium]
MRNIRYKSAILLCLYGLSGVTALAYEVLWTRMLSLLFGTSILGVVVTVAAFMLGLGMGSFLGYRWQGSLKRTLRTLAGIEIGVALYAVSLPAMMQFLQGLWLSVDAIHTWQFWQVISALLVLSLPAVALGFAFPWVLRVGKSWQLSLGKLYGINTLGGALGALLPLLLLPWLGWLLALQCVAILGATIGLILFWLSFHVDAEINNDTCTTSNLLANCPSPKFVCLLAYAGMGAGALMLEIAWARAYGMILLRTEYVLAVILSVFLIGIGLGSLLAKRLPRETALQCLPAIVAIMAILGLYAFPYVNDLGHSLTFDSLFAALLFQGLLIAVSTLPATLAMGAWLPLIAREGEGASLYAANSLGACAGALLAGLVLIPWVGTALTWLLAAALIMLCAYYWLQAGKRLFYICVSTVMFIILAWPVQQLPSASKLLAHELPHATDLYQREDAVSITHVVEQQDGQRVLLADLQRMDASTDPTSVEVQRNQARLPLFLHGSAKEVLFLGLGTGITASGALAWPDVNLHAVELSSGAIAAAGIYFNQVNNDAVGHIDIQHDDARRFLMRTNKRYDVIIGDLFHPDQVGRGALLSLEQFGRAKARLNKQGLFAQWLAFNQFDITSLQVVLRSFAQIFPKNAIFVDGYRVALIGFTSEKNQRASFLLSKAPAIDTWGGEGGWTWLGRYWGAVSDVLRGDTSTKLQGEWSPVIEYALPHMRYAHTALSDVLDWFVKHRVGFHDGAKVWGVNDGDRSIVNADAMQAFKRAWAATSLIQRAQLAALQGNPESGRLQALAYRANDKNRWAGFVLADAMFASLSQGVPLGMNRQQALQKILRIRKDHEGALQALMVLAMENKDYSAWQQFSDKLHQISPYNKILSTEKKQRP